MKQKVLSVFAVLVVVAGFQACKNTPPVPGNCLPQKAEYLANGKKMMYWPTAGRSKDTALVLEYTEITPRVFRETQKYIGWETDGSLPAWKDTVVKTIYKQCCGTDIALASIAFGIENNFGTAKNFYIKGIRSAGDKWEFTLDSTKYYMGCIATNTSYVDPPYFTTPFNVDKIWMKSTPAIVPCDTILWSDKYGVVSRLNPVDPTKTLRLKWIK
jgi:hypothetical protein